MALQLKGNLIMETGDLMINSINVMKVIGELQQKTEQLEKKLHIVESEKKVLQERVEEMYYAPEMPGYMMAKFTFEEVHARVTLNLKEMIPAQPTPI